MTSHIPQTPKNAQSHCGGVCWFGLCRQPNDEEAKTEITPSTVSTCAPHEDDGSRKGSDRIPSYPLRIRHFVWQRYNPPNITEIDGFHSAPPSPTGNTILECENWDGETCRASSGGASTARSSVGKNVPEYKQELDIASICDTLSSSTPFEHQRPNREPSVAAVSYGSVAPAGAASIVKSLSSNRASECAAQHFDERSSSRLHTRTHSLPSESSWNSAELSKTLSKKSNSQTKADHAKNENAKILESKSDENTPPANTREKSRVPSVIRENSNNSIKSAFASGETNRSSPLDVPAVDGYLPSSTNISDVIPEDAPADESLRRPRVGSWEFPHPAELNVPQKKIEEMWEQTKKAIESEDVIKAHRQFSTMMKLLYDCIEASGVDVFVLVRPLQEYLRDQQEFGGNTYASFRRLWDSTGPVESASILGMESHQNLGALEGKGDLKVPPMRQGSRTRRFLRSSRSRQRRSHTTSLKGTVGVHVYAEQIRVCPPGCWPSWGCENLPHGDTIVRKPTSAVKNQEKQKDANGNVERGLEAIIRGKELLAREPLTRLIWPVGDLPCFIFSFVEEDGSGGGEITDAHIDALAAMGRTTKHRNKGREGCVFLNVGLEVFFRFRDPKIHSEMASFLFGRRKRSSMDISGSPVGDEGSVLLSNYEKWLWLHSRVEDAINQAIIHKLRYSFDVASVSFDILSEDMPTDKSWGRLNTSRYSASWKMWEDGAVIAIIDGYLECTLQQLLCLLYESDLHKTWIPFLADSRRIHPISLYSQVVRHLSKLPWPLHDRETMVVGFAVDALMESGPGQTCVMMSGGTVPSDTTAVWGLPVSPPPPGVTRWEFTQFVFCLYPAKDKSNKIQIKLLLNLNAKMSFIPRTIQNFIAKQALNKFFSTLQKMCTNMPGSKHEKLQAENPEFYSLLNSRLEMFYNAANN